MHRQAKCTQAKHQNKTHRHLKYAGQTDAKSICYWRSNKSFDFLFVKTMCKLILSFHITLAKQNTLFSYATGIAHIFCVFTFISQLNFPENKNKHIFFFLLLNFFLPFFSLSHYSFVRRQYFLFHFCFSHSFDIVFIFSCECETFVTFYG